MKISMTPFAIIDLHTHLQTYRHIHINFHDYVGAMIMATIKFLTFMYEPARQHVSAQTFPCWLGPV